MSKAGNVRIKILGTRGEIEASAPYHSKHSGMLINNELLVDLGEKEYLDYNPKRIILTHLHPDHAFFIRRGRKAEIDVPVYAPEEYDDKGIRVKKFGDKKNLIGYTICAFPTIHSLKVKSQAYLITINRKRILYTGDMIWIEKKYHEHFKNLDLVVTEASFVRKGGMVRRDRESGKIYGHAGVPRLVSTFSEFTDHIVLIHFGSWLYKDIDRARKQIKAIADEHGVRVDLGYDGMEIEL